MVAKSTNMQASQIPLDDRRTPPTLPSYPSLPRDEETGGVVENIRPVYGEPVDDRSPPVDERPSQLPEETLRPVYKPGGPLEDPGDGGNPRPPGENPQEREDTSTPPTPGDPMGPSTPEDTGAPEDTGTGPTQSLTEEQRNFAKKAREEMVNNLEDPLGSIRDKHLLQEYTNDNTLLKDPVTGELILDADGNPQEDVSLSLDPLEYQMRERQQLEAGQYGGVSMGEAAQGTAAQTEGVTLGPAEQAQAAADVAMRDFETSLLDPDELHKGLDAIAELEPMKAASMADKMNELLAGMEEGVVPLWARPAVTKVEQALAGRGISASSIGRDSLFNAIIQSAMPIAQQDATFEQQANQTNYNAKVEAIMDDTRQANAALQFNATSLNQAAQFKSQLQAQIDSQNASRKDAMAQFNAAAQNQRAEAQGSLDLQTNIANMQSQNQMNIANMDAANRRAEVSAQLQQQAGLANMQAQNQMVQFNANLDAQRDQFNTQVSAQIAQATVQWRRQMNSANTAGQNAVNQANTQNAFNLSNQALSNLWQQSRDEAHWEYLATEQEKDRRAQLEATVLARESSTAAEIGGFLSDLDLSYESIADGISDLGEAVSEWWNED